MNYVKMIVMCLFVSCSCSNRNEDAEIVSNTAHVMTLMDLPDENIRDTATMETIAENKPSPEAKINVDVTTDTNNVLKNASKKRKISPPKKVVTKVRIDNKKCGCYGLKEKPLTDQDAVACSRYHWEVAKKLTIKKMIDSAYLHCNRALSLNENGSLFCLKAELLLSMRDYAAALEASEVAINRDDYWNLEDRAQSQKIKCESLIQLYYKYPSSRVLKELKKDCLKDTKDYSVSLNN